MHLESLFEAIGAALPETEKGNLFGKPCYKLGGKAFICFFQGEMVFKLPPEAHREAMALEGAKLFDPSGKGRPMKEWVQVPGHYADRWEAFAKAAAMMV